MITFKLLNVLALGVFISIRSVIWSNRFDSLGYPIRFFLFFGYFGSDIRKFLDHIQAVIFQFRISEHENFRIFLDIRSEIFVFKTEYLIQYNQKLVLSTFPLKISSLISFRISDDPIHFGSNSDRFSGSEISDRIGYSK